MTPATAGSDRDLATAPRVATVDPALAEAVALAKRHTRARLPLPELEVEVIWVSRAGAYHGQMLGTPGGRCHIRLNLAEITSPRDAALVVLHELRHAHDHHTGRLAGMSAEEAEARANEFAGEVVRHPDFYSLSCRRLSRPAMRGADMDYEEFIKMGGVSGNLRGPRAAALLEQHRAHQTATRRAAPLSAGEVRCGKCLASGFRIRFNRYRCRGCDALLDHTGAVVLA